MGINPGKYGRTLTKDRNFDIRTLDSNQILINHRLYNIDLKGAHSVSEGIREPLTELTFARRKGQHLYIVDRDGKQVNKKGYILLDTIAFKVEDVPVVTFHRLL